MYAPLVLNYTMSAFSVEVCEFKRTPHTQQTLYAAFNLRVKDYAVFRLEYLASLVVQSSTCTSTCHCKGVSHLAALLYAYCIVLVAVCFCSVCSVIIRFCG